MQYVFHCPPDVRPPLRSPIATTIRREAENEVMGRTQLRTNNEDRMELFLENMGAERRGEDMVDSSD